jgi:predicted PurR-regulated permease PerM
MGLNVGFITFTLILIAIFCFTQLIDNILYQPLIYSTSIKAKPLEIFIVLLIAGHIAGPLGMIVAIPSYTVVRVVAFRFFRQYKAISRLIPSEKLITEE